MFGLCIFHAKLVIRSGGTSTPTAPWNWREARAMWQKWPRTEASNSSKDPPSTFQQVHPAQLLFFSRARASLRIQSSKKHKFTK